jgi:hypothetical protein
LPLDVKLSNYSGGGAFRQGTDYGKVSGTAEPWLYASGYRGLRSLELPVMAAGDGEAAYTVRLHFAETEGDTSGRRFGIKLQGQDVAKDIDVAALAGGPERALVREFRGIEAAESIQVDLVAASDKPAAEQMPLVQGVEVLRERVTRVGLLAASPSLLNRRRPTGKALVRITNHKPQAFVGSLRFVPPNGLRVVPATQAVNVPSGSSSEVEIEVAADPATLAMGMVPIPVELIQADGANEAKTVLRIEYLADRDRMVVSAAEDTYVGPSFGLNRGTNGSMLVDGGDRKIGDSSHHVAYLRFRLDKIPGTVVSARLRLYNAGNPSSDGGRIHVVPDDWDPAKLSYRTRPKSGEQVGDIKAVASQEVLEIPLAVELQGKKELRLVIEADNCDGTDYLTRESGSPAELRIEYTQ